MSMNKTCAISSSIRFLISVNMSVLGGEVVVPGNNLNSSADSREHSCEITSLTSSLRQESTTGAINNSTLSGNSASLGGSSIWNTHDGTNGSSTLTVGDTILKAGASGENILNQFGTVTSLGYNLSSDAADGDGTTAPGGFLNATGDQRNTDPLLGPLQNNLGPTFTHALLVGSPAINAGDPSFNPNAFDPPLLYDQRGSGFPRVANSRIDIGAFELQQSRCPHPQGYWKTNPALWRVTSLTLGSQTYTKTQLVTILKTAVGTGTKADASLILADQLIATKLNIANGSDPAPVSSTITHADSLLSGFAGKLPYKVKTSSVSGQKMVNDANTLTRYNNGSLTPVCSP